MGSKLCQVWQNHHLCCSRHGGFQSVQRSCIPDCMNATFWKIYRGHRPWSHRCFLSFVFLPRGTLNSAICNSCPIARLLYRTERPLFRSPEGNITHFKTITNGLWFYKDQELINQNDRHIECLMKHCILLSYSFVDCVCVHAQSCPTLCWTVGSSVLPGSSVHGISQVRILEWVAIPSSRGSSQPKGQILLSCVSSMGKCVLYHWATWKALICRLRGLTKATIFWALMGQALCKCIWYTIIHNPHNSPTRQVLSICPF